MGRSGETQWTTLLVAGRKKPAATSSRRTPAGVAGVAAAHAPTARSTGLETTLTRVALWHARAGSPANVPGAVANGPGPLSSALPTSTRSTPAWVAGAAAAH